MAVHTVFLHLVVILLAARLCAEIAARLGVPSVVGEIAATTLLAPFGLKALYRRFPGDAPRGQQGHGVAGDVRR